MKLAKMNLVSSTIHILSDKKVLEHDKLIIMTSEMGNKTFQTACEDSSNKLR